MGGNVAETARAGQRSFFFQKFCDGLGRLWRIP
jgi:hypothetical protein